ncbi:uncharacterized protein EKO05_0000340 [Ascochyta rabiei]|uniref:Uncharacterized protein n=1 Tax=Didymella rabiei TaxID=5454 RepID=A0A162VC10_DIDRA|nr:uncharacterized protein EKO05_0000340 [Ascochyta rabiei]KZM18354.1 hypothetical protein ST47_g10455 [Ascochyta rabiei]UPX09656.1 hypothetical protein EKO05_0000340 [Ascochyta rabiei]
MASYTTTRTSSSSSNSSSSTFSSPTLSPTPTYSSPTPHDPTARRLSLTIQNQHIPCTEREAQLLSLLGFAPSDPKTGLRARCMAGLG